MWSERTLKTLGLWIPCFDLVTIRWELVEQGIEVDGLEVGGIQVNDLEEVGMEQDSEVVIGEMEGGSRTSEIDDDKRDKGMRSSWISEIEEEMELRKEATVELGEDATENQSRVVWDKKWNLRVCEIRIIRALVLVVLKNYIVIFSTTNHKNGAAMVEL